MRTLIAGAALAMAVMGLGRAEAAYHFSTNLTDGAMGMASQTDAGGKLEIEAADDFILPTDMIINHATFTGLVTGVAAPGVVTGVTVELYRVFPLDSNTVRVIQVPTRANSPSDVAFDARSAAGGNLTFGTTVLSGSFTASNSVLNGINPSPNQHTGGEGAVTGQEILFDVTFTTPFNLPADHYFFIPQVDVTGGQFYWLSSSRPITAGPGTPFSPDLQAWIRNENLAPDWLRVGTDIVGGTTPPQFNGTFTLDGVPEPGSLGVLGLGVVGLVWRRLRRM